MRIAIGGIFHESNTFVPQITSMEDVNRSHYHTGKEIIDFWRDTTSEIAGYIDVANQDNVELVPTLMAWIMPSGTVSQTVYDELSQELLRLIGSAGQLDGVLLCQHGAWVTEDEECTDGALLSLVRNAVGEDVPVVATLDFHANVTSQMLDSVDAVVGYKTYPHVDQRETGAKAARLIIDMASGGTRPKMALNHPPLIVNIMRQLTCDEGPMADVMAIAAEAENTPGVLAVNVFGGFAYSDVPHAGCSVMTVTDGEKSLAQATADDLADEVWRRRHEFAKGLPDAEEAVRAAIAETDGLVVLADTGDNVGGGSPGDGTVLLSELLEQGADGALALLCDPDAVAKAIEAGVTNEVTLSVGGNHDHLHGTPLSVTGTVRLISDGRWINRGEMHDGVSENQGRTAVVDLGGVTLVLTERKHYMWNLEQLRAIGIEPKDQQIIVNKSAIAYRAAYGPIAATMIEVATPGACPVDLSAISYHRIKRPVFPLDAM